jgi:hypothetical protein
VLYSKSIRQNSGLSEASYKNNGDGDPIGNLFSELASVATLHYTSCGTTRCQAVTVVMHSIAAFTTCDPCFNPIRIERERHVTVFVFYVGGFVWMKR